MSIGDVLSLRCDLSEEFDANAYNISDSQNRFTFEKKSDKTRYYVTKTSAGKWRCTCTGFKYRGTCKHCEYANAHSNTQAVKRHKREVITDATKDILPKLKRIAPDSQIVGSYRREKADSKDIDIIMDCSASEFKKVNDLLKEYPNFKPVVSGDSIIRGYVNINGDDIEMDINRLAEKSNPALTLLYRTGPGDFNVAMRSMAKDRGGCLNENELVLDGHVIEVETEKDVFDALGIEYLEPKDRCVENIHMRPKSDMKYLQVYKDGKPIGPAASRAYARGQESAIRDMTKKIARAPITEGGQLLDIKFTVHTDENDSADVDIRTSKGAVVPSKQVKLIINPSVKVLGRKVPLDNNVEYMGKTYKLGDVLEKIWNTTIKAEMKIPNNGVAKEYPPKVTLEGGKLVFVSVPYGENTRV